MSEFVEGVELHIGHRSMAASFLAALTGCVALAGVSSAPAGAQVYPPNRCSLALSVSAAIPGQTIIAGSANCSPGFAARARVEITLESDPLYLGTGTPGAGPPKSQGLTSSHSLPLRLLGESLSLATRGRPLERPARGAWHRRGARLGGIARFR